MREGGWHNAEQTAHTKFWKKPRYHNSLALAEADGIAHYSSTRNDD
jgi:hypothetical protein